jgi:hypothetical protein
MYILYSCVHIHFYLYYLLIKKFQMEDLVFLIMQTKNCLLQWVFIYQEKEKKIYLACFNLCVYLSEVLVREFIKEGKKDSLSLFPCKIPLLLFW